MTRSVPTDEDFARARSAMEQRDQGLDDVRSTILGRFEKAGLQQAFIMYSSGADLFVMHLFFVDEPCLKASQQSGLVEQIQSVALNELERVGRGDKSRLKVELKLHTAEDGNYDAILR